MQFQGYRIPLVLLIAAITVGLLIGGQTFYKQQTVNDPIRSVLTDHPAVIEHEIEERQNELVIHAVLDRIDDLHGTYRKLQEEIDAVVGERPYRLEVDDRRSDALDAAYRSVHLDIYEGLETGELGEMNRRVDEVLSEQGIDYQLRVDEKQLYVALYQDEAYLYEIIDRTMLRGQEPQGGPS